MADPTEKRFTVDFNVQLDATHKAMLEQLAEDAGSKMSPVVRKLIDSAYRMRFNAEPKCVTGANCLCPQVHALQRGTQISGAELVRQQRASNGAT